MDETSDNKPKPSHGGFGQFFPTGTYTKIGTNVPSLKHVMKSTMKKKLFLLGGFLTELCLYILII